MPPRVGPHHSPTGECAWCGVKPRGGWWACLDCNQSGHLVCLRLHQIAHHGKEDCSIGAEATGHKLTPTEASSRLEAKKTDRVRHFTVPEGANAARKRLRFDTDPWN